ncbi:hypothetical protein BELL_0255g00010 [Botrytis elliptica]|uniref:Uncharacterized protein n=1 Tax=Botrytis elliptica TaxID=278938 RepID=A0A4Z1JMK8_9HELO|nr:hypothetical protein EAE99_007419 [Botrytis elliptica]TGO74798.1 hypothetical protein BELL_0255g00010 [Botrytis elliptica]
MSRRPIRDAVSGIIGFGTDAYASFKEKKVSAGESEERNVQRAKTPEASESPTIEHNSFTTAFDAHGYESYDEDDEGDWVRDNTQAELSPYDQEIVDEPESVKQILGDFGKQHPGISSSTRPNIKQGLPVPIIIPERRPGSKHRGFVRAYAPVLIDCGIDQDTFMDFLVGFEASIKASPYFHVINLAVAASVMAEGLAVAPSIIVHAAAFAVHTSIEFGRRAYMSKEYVPSDPLIVKLGGMNLILLPRQNKYLVGMNEKLFKPHGLYAMLMTWKSNNSTASQPLVSTVDMNTKLVTSVASREVQGRSGFHSTSGKTIGQSQMPESAELIFPLLETATDEQKVNAMKKAGVWFGEWRDKRSTAKFATENPSTTLVSNAGEQQVPSSRWADPSHPVNQGGIIGVLSGGHLGRTARKERRRERKGLPKDENPKPQRTGILKTAKRKLHEDVLYLMIVNMPSDEEMKIVTSMAKEKKAGVS